MELKHFFLLQKIMVLAIMMILEILGHMDLKELILAMT